MSAFFFGECLFAFFCYYHLRLCAKLLCVCVCVYVCVYEGDSVFFLILKKHHILKIWCFYLCTSERFPRFSLGGGKTYIVYQFFWLD